MNGDRTSMIYWVSTGLLAVIMVFGASQDVLHAEGFVATMHRLRYPEYLLTILGLAKLLGTSALLYPGIPRLKEWAYAGFTFNLSGAIVSFVVTGCTFVDLLPAILCGTLLSVSYISYRARTRWESLNATLQAA